MTKTKNTKRALVLSALALIMCFSMFVGSTYAWFTDSVTSTGNIIQSGTLKIALHWADGDEAIDSAVWQDASQGAIFDYDKWEPGYIQARHLKISNIGTLAFQYQMQILANGVVSELADVIDVYFFEEAVQTSRASFTADKKVGTLSDILNGGKDNSLAKTITGTLLAEDGKDVQLVTIAFKMQENAGNDYQGLSIGSDFSIRLFATQLNHEEDSFDKNYDITAQFPAQELPNAIVKQIPEKDLSINVVQDNGTNSAIKLDTGYQFLPTEEYDAIEDTKYANWHADYVVYADNAVPANSMMLAGYYKLFDEFMNLDGAWIGLTSADAINADTPIRLLKDGLGKEVSYYEICALGNDGTGFLCGAVDLTGANAGTTLTVELRLYETKDPADTENNTTNEETGNYIVIGTFEHVFGGEKVTDDDGAVYFYGDDGSVVLLDAYNVTASSYTVKEGTTLIDDGAFSWNTSVKTVTIPATVTAYTKDAAKGTGAFKNSSIETAILEEGITEIPAFAFNQATKLTSVTIPSTVKSIGLRAFRATALTEVVLHSGIESISQAFRDMPYLEKVTVEGNTAISDFSFRDCPSLRNVYLNGEDITLGGGTTFCNASTNNPGANNITFHVVNETVAQRVKTAMGSGTNFYIYYVNGEQFQ